jgi:endonuclease YncB( thermonuclease family)
LSVVGKVVPYRRRNRVWRPSDSRRQRAAKVVSPFTPLYLLVVVSGLGWLWFEFGEPVRDRISATLAGPQVGECGTLSVGTCVVDGDTIEHLGWRVRLADINTPEIGGAQCQRELALGLRAKQRLIELMSEGPFEIVSVGDRDTDVYGRKLRLVERHGESLGNRLVSEGLAHRWNGYRQNWCS